MSYPSIALKLVCNHCRFIDERFNQYYYLSIGQAAGWVVGSIRILVDNRFIYNHFHSPKHVCRIVYFFVISRIYPRAYDVYGLITGLKFKLAFVFFVRLSYLERH